MSNLIADLELLISNWRYLIKHERSQCGRTYSHTARMLEINAQELQMLIDKAKESTQEPIATSYEREMFEKWFAMKYPTLAVDGMLGHAVPKLVTDVARDTWEVRAALDQHQRESIASIPIERLKALHRTDIRIYHSESGPSLDQENNSQGDWVAWSDIEALIESVQPKEK